MLNDVQNMLKNVIITQIIPNNMQIYKKKLKLQLKLQPQLKLKLKLKLQLKLSGHVD